MSDISDKFPQDSHLVIVSQLSQNKIHKFSIKFENKDLSDMTIDELSVFSEHIEDDVFAVLTLEGSVAARDHIGGTAPQQVKAAASRALKKVAAR